MDKFLERYNFPRLNKRELENINRPVTSNDIETVIKNLPTNRSPGPDGFTGKFYQTFREEVTPILLKLFQNLQRNTPKVVLISHHHPDTKTRQRYHKKRKLQTNITDEHRCKNPEQNTSKQNPTAH